MNVWGVSEQGKTDIEIAEAGLDAMEEYMKELGVVMHAAEVGLTEDLIKEIAESTRIMSGGYRTLTTEEIEEILRESM